MKPRILSQALHKWLGLLVGIQLLVWTVSGFYMVVVNIDIIHGDHLIKTPKPISGKRISHYSKQLSSLANSHPSATAIEIAQLGDRAVIQVRSSDLVQLFDAQTGAPLPPLDEAAISALAQGYYAGTSNILSPQLLKDNPPSEIGSRALPLWRVDVDDVWGTSLYISPANGSLVTRRHTLWRVFDFFWMVHIMDYAERENINNPLLRVVSTLSLALVLSGFWYLYFRLNVRSWTVRSSR